MVRFKNHLLIVVGFAIAGLIGVAFGTGTAQAVVSTLVTIVNTAANPVLTQHVAADNPATQAVWLFCDAFVASSATATECQLADSTGNAYTVPTGERLVIESFSGFSYVKTGGRLTIQYETFQGGNPFNFYPPVAFQRQAFNGTNDFYVWGTSRAGAPTGKASAFCTGWWLTRRHPPIDRS